MSIILLACMELSPDNLIIHGIKQGTIGFSKSENPFHWYSCVSLSEIIIMLDNLSA